MSKSNTAKRLVIVHGPNLNLLGERSPELYGSLTLKELNGKLTQLAKQKKCQLQFFQSNHEGELIDFLHRKRKWADGIVINPGAYTHYSYALRDAIEATTLAAVEVHLSDIHQREDFRKISVIAPVCVAQISGKGWMSYAEGVELLLTRLQSTPSRPSRRRSHN